MKRKHTILLLTGAVLLAVSIFGVTRMKRALAIDACLDRGGKWDYELDICVEPEKITADNYTSFYWHTGYDSLQQKEELIRGVSLDAITHSPEELIRVLNMRPAECSLELVEIVGDTVVVRVLNEEFLSERMGSTGAYCYLGETVFTLTEHDAIRHVRIDMNYGSHAGPGVYDRTSFEYLVIRE